MFILLLRSRVVPFFLDFYYT